jgi:Protein of unknown function (DUF3768)
VTRSADTKIGVPPTNNLRLGQERPPRQTQPGRFSAPLPRTRRGQHQSNNSDPPAYELSFGGRVAIEVNNPIQQEDNAMDAKTDAIRQLNDNLRKTLTGGRAVITPGIAALGPEAVSRVIRTIAVFDDFCHANDPHQEHDFGAFEAEGRMVFFKIDYFDNELTYHSPDPADPAVTQRVITIMLADEY